NMPAGVKLELRPVIVVRRPHRAYDGNIVDAIADMRPPVAGFNAAFAVLAIADLHRKNLRVHFVQADDYLAQVFLQVRRFERFFVRRLRDGLAGVLIQFRLWIKRLHLARAADHEEPDDVPGFGSEVRKAFLTVSRARFARNAVARQHGSKGEAGEAHAEVGEETAAAWLTAIRNGFLEGHRRNLSGRRLVLS